MYHIERCIGDICDLLPQKRQKVSRAWQIITYGLINLPQIYRKQTNFYREINFKAKVEAIVTSASYHFEAEMW